MYSVVYDMSSCMKCRRVACFDGVWQPALESGVCRELTASLHTRRVVSDVTVLLWGKRRLARDVSCIHRFLDLTEHYYAHL